MGIYAIPGSLAYEEMVRRQMLNRASATPAPNTGGIGTTNPLTNPNYQNFKALAQGTGTNYGVVEGMLQRNPAVAQGVGYTPEGFAQQTGAGYSGMGGGGGAGGYGGIDPGLLAAIDIDFNRSRQSAMGNQRNYEKRLRGDYNQRFGGAETGFLHLAQKESRDQLDESLATNEVKRNRELALARERAEERALRAREAEQARRDRQIAINTTAYQGGGYKPESSRGEGQYTGADAAAASGRYFGATFASPLRLPLGGGGGGGSTAPPPGAPPPPGQNNQQGGGGGGGDPGGRIDPGQVNGAGGTYQVPYTTATGQRMVPSGQGGYKPDPGAGAGSANNQSFGARAPSTYDRERQLALNRQMNGMPAGGGYAPTVFNSSPVGSFIASRPSGGGGGGYGGYR